VLITAMASPAAAAEVRWKTVIGIIQAGNMVGSIQGGGQPWSTLSGQARADLLSGRVEFEVRGLVLAGGNAIGPVNEARRQQPGIASIDCVGFTKGV
jgi:hypothetical protein